MNDFFVAEEYQTRLTRVRTAMQNRRLDALLLTAPTNVEYFSGHRPLVGWDTLTRSSFCLVPAAGDPILIVHDVWLGGAVADSAWHDVPRPFIPRSASAAGATGAGELARRGTGDLGCAHDQVTS